MDLSAENRGKDIFMKCIAWFSILPCLLLSLTLPVQISQVLCHGIIETPNMKLEKIPGWLLYAQATQRPESCPQLSQRGAQEKLSIPTPAGQLHPSHPFLYIAGQTTHA